MLPIALQYNVLAGGQALDSTLQAVISQIVASMTAAFTEIKGATWSAATDTLEDIAAASAPSAGTIADAVAAIDIDGLLTLKESLIAHNAALAGKMIVGGSTIAFRNTSDTKDVIVATMDAGSRSAIVLDVT